MTIASNPSGRRIFWGSVPAISNVRFYALIMFFAIASIGVVKDVFKLNGKNTHSKFLVAI